MYDSKVKRWKLVLEAALLVACGAVCLRPAFFSLIGAAESARADVAPADASGGKVKELLMERLATLREVVSDITKEYNTGKVSFDRVQRASFALLEAELQLCASA